MGAGRSVGVGLRGQIVLALTLAFAVSFSLLSVAVIRLTDRAREVDRLADARTVAAAAVRLVGTEEAARRVGGALLAGGARDVVGLEVRVGDRILFAGGERTGRSVRSVEAGRAVELWLSPRGSTATAPLTNLLLLYVALTAGAILLFAYAGLTYLIVRPLEAVTRASERLATSRSAVRVPVRGASEVARLAESFNAMADQLQAERRALEDRLVELERTTRQLGRAQEQVLRAERLASVGRLSAGIAHEIGNPLAAILGFIELLRGGGLDEPKREEFLRRIQRETERIHKIIRDLLDFSRQGRDDVPVSRVDLVQVVEDAVRLVGPQKDLRHVTIERRLERDVLLARGDRDRLTQVVLNLLLNAADAIGGEGTIRVEVGAAADGNEARLVVADTGPGIDPKVLPNLFEPFVTTKPVGEGTGLGLAVCHTIVAQAGGTITASNPPEGGARFEVRLPLAEDDAAPPGSRAR